MMIDSDTLPKIATVLEKLAEYIENVEASKVAEVINKKTAAAKALADKLSTATGEDIDENVVQKLAELDPEVAAMIGKFAGDATSVDSMGGPEEGRTEKTASAGDSADARFIGWVTGP
ncbi:MAG: hypothetical protein DRP83_00015 [Planctomycetota bacterium]|nr:MAG: hypothetical protein DRP83_00015 [Planctomycetota bacterium]